MLRRGVAWAMLILAGVVLVVAVVDHRRKQAHIDRVEVDNWYCTHLGERCATPDADRYEARWQRREYAYGGLVVVLLAGALVAGVDRTSLEKGLTALRRNRYRE